MSSLRQKNEQAFQDVKADLASRFPRGHFVAFDDGHLVADAPTFDQLTDVLSALGKDRPDVFVVQVGIEYPDEVFILL